MLLKAPAQKCFRVAGLLWALFATTLFLSPVAAAPQRLSIPELSRRNGPTPGIGVELEVGQIVIVGKHDLTPEQREHIKGAVMTPVGFAGEEKLHWELTAEIGPLQVLPEAIVDGLKNKVGEHKTKVIGGQIFKFFQEWEPCRAKDCKVIIKGFDDLGPWTVKWPKDTPVDIGKLGFGPQVTTAMPLGAVLHILADSKNKNTAKNPLASSGALFADKFIILTKESFKPFSQIKPADITEDFLGFFSLLASYCVLADSSNPSEGPKRLLPIMPRTDFVTQYLRFVEPKLKQQLSKGTSLYDIIEKVAGANAELAKKVFKWKPGTTREIPESWTGKAEDLKTGHLEVGKFLDYLQGHDKATKKTLPHLDLVKLMDKALRHGQIGSLGDKMETVLGTSKPAPVFEFRDLDRIFGQALATTMGSFENKVIEYHKHFEKREGSDSM